MNIELTMVNHTFSGDDAVFVLYFHDRVAEESDTLGMNEWKLIVWLPHLQTKNASHNFRSASTASR